MIPSFATRREVSLMGETWTQALAISKEDIEALWAKVSEDWHPETLRSLNASTDPSQAFEVFRADDGLLSLWLGETRLAMVKR